MDASQITNFILGALQPHMHRITIDSVWGGARARVDGVVVCNRATTQDAMAFAMGRLYTMLLAEQVAQACAQQAAYFAAQRLAMPRVSGWMDA